MLIEAYVAAALACVILGVLIGLAWGAAETAQLERQLTDERRARKGWWRAAYQWEKQANLWRNRARLHEQMHTLERQILGIAPLPNDDHNGSRKAPDLQLVQPDDPAHWYAAKAWERQQERAAHGEER